MKQMVLTLLVLACSWAARAQFQFTELDKSPMDMSYFPVGYPILKFQNKNAPAVPKARVVYSRPQKNGRTIFGNIVPYNEVWRMGANESTEIEFFQEVTIRGTKVPKGRYTMYCIPQATQWTMIINKGLNSWGAFSYSKAADVLRVDVPVAATEAPVEYFSIGFDQQGNLLVFWDVVKVSLPIRYGS